ncbi:histone-like nucleoid-structuring protein MvaT [Pseudomonas aeruginosa]
MSLINEYRQTEEAIKELQNRLTSLSSDGRLQKELEFEQKLRSLMGEYSKSLKDVIGILDPAATKGDKPHGSKGVKRARKLKQYKNPNTGEVIETKGGNHKTLKEWKEKWGAATVESWATFA